MLFIDIRDYLYNEHYLEGGLYKHWCNNPIYNSLNSMISSIEVKVDCERIFEKVGSFIEIK